jgi:hypothetical protein
MVLTNGEAGRLAAYFMVTGRLDAPETKRALSEKAREHLLGLISKGRTKKA